MYSYTQAATAAVLLLAANTAYSDFPRVLFLLARTCNAPRLLLRIGDRLAFTNGTIALSVAAGVIYVAFGGVTESLIPLYAVVCSRPSPCHRRGWSLRALPKVIVTTVPFHLPGRRALSSARR